MPLSPRTLRPSSNWTPKSISGLALWLDASDSQSLFTTDAGAVTAVSSPTDIAGCVGWWDASDAASITQSGGLVSQWNDKSGNNRHATASGSLRPTSGGSQNGRTVMQFTGTQALTITGNFLQSENVTLFAVAMKNTDHYGGIITSAPTNPEDSPLLGFYSTTIALVNRRQVVQQALANGVYGIVCGQANGTSQQGWFNGVKGTDSVASAAPNTAGTITKIGAFRTSGAADLNGNIAEIVCYSGNLSVAQRASVEAYLAAKWGISGVHRPVSQELTAVSSPTEIAGLTEWFDATDAATVTLSGGKVSSWASKVAGGRTLTQATDSLRPVMTDNIQNGLRMAKFDGVDDYIRTATPETFADKTVFIVARPTDVSASQAVWGASKQNITLYGYYYSAGFRVSSAAVVVRPETAGATARRVAASANEAIITSLQFKTSEVVAANFSSTAPYKNGTLFDTNDSVVLADYGIGSTMGANDSRPAAGVLSNFYSGYIGEVLIYDAYLSAVDRARVEKYLQQKWATPTVPDPTPPVGAWLDKSGNARHATQSTSANRPLVGAAVANGRRGVNFGTAGNSQRLGWLPSSGTQDWREVIAVAVYDRSASTFADVETLFSGHNTNSGTSLGIGLSGEPANMFTSQYGTFLPETNINALGHVATSLVRPFPTISSPFVVIARATSAVTPVAVAGYVVGNDRQFSPNRNWRGRISEVIAFERALTASERNKIVRYLASKYGITLAPQVANADAQDWVNRVYANGGTVVSSSTAAAVNAFCDAIDAANIRDRFYRLNLFCGGTSGTTAGLAACLVPLYRGPSLGGTQYGNTTDTNVGPFVSGDYAETGASGGLLGNGTSKYLNTGLTVSDIGTAASGHMAVYHGQSSGATTNRYYMGANDASTANRFYLGTDAFVSASVVAQYGATQSASQTLASQGHGTAGHRILSRETDSLLTHYHNGSVVGTNTTGITPAVSTAAFAVFAVNRNGTVDRWHNSWIAAYSIGLGLNSTQAANYRTIMQTFQTAMGRNV